MSSKQHCLLVLSSNKEGVSAPSFIQAFTLTHTSFIVQIATPQGNTPEFVQLDEQSKRWLADFKAKSFSTPIALDSVDVDRYSCLLVPHGYGAAYDLVADPDLAQIVSRFKQHKKPMCLIGMGVCALFSTVDSKGKWMLENTSLTGLSVMEVARSQYFGQIDHIPQDFILSHRGKYSHSESDNTHVVIDGHIITGQNQHATLTGVQNLILLCNQKKK